MSRREIYSALVQGGPLPNGINSPFERALLGERPTCLMIRAAVDAVAGPVVTETDPQKCLATLRAAILKRRTEPNMPKAVGRDDALDSKLFDARPVSQPIADPPPLPPATPTPTPSLR